MKRVGTVAFGRRAFLGRATLTAIAAGLDGPFPAAASAADPSLPDSVGVSAAAVGAFLDAVEASPHEAHSLVIARHGQISARGWWRPYRAEVSQRLYSLSKSFTSTAVGLAVSAGTLRLSDKVIDFFPQQTPAQVSDHLAALRVEHLLTMSVGHSTDTTPTVTHEQDWVKTFLALPIEARPGSVFLYNSAASYMLSAIVQTVVGEKIVDYLRPRFFDPLGLPQMHWSECPRGFNTGGWGLSATTETLAKFGQFYLQKGRWKGRKLLPREWVERATRAQIQQPAAPGQDLEELERTSDWHQGYGYQFWRCRNDAYRGDGAFGQFCIVLPEQDAVIAITSRTPDMQGLLNLVWKHLLPGLRDAARPAKRNSAEHVRERLASLTLQPPSNCCGSLPKPEKNLVYTVEPNALRVSQLMVSHDADSLSVALQIDGRIHKITSGIGKWRDGATDLPGTPPELTELIGTYANPTRPAKLAAAGAWKDPQTFEMQWRYYETPHFDTVTLRFARDRLDLTFLNSLTQMAAAVHPETRPALAGVRRF